MTNDADTIVHRIDILSKMGYYPEDDYTRVIAEDDTDYLSTLEKFIEANFD
jgi:hypothetical protein